MRNNLLTIGVVLFIVCIIAALAMPGVIRQRVVPTESASEIKLRREFDSLVEVNNILEKRFVIDSLQIDSLSKNVAKDKEKIVYLNNNRNEKVKVIRALDNDGLYLFFSNFKTDSVK